MIKFYQKSSSNSNPVILLIIIVFTLRQLAHEPLRRSEFVCSMAARFCARTSVACIEICYTSRLRLFRREIKARAYIWPNSDTKSSISTSKNFFSACDHRESSLFCAPHNALWFPPNSPEPISQNRKIDLL